LSSIYLDTSAFLAVLFGEPQSTPVLSILRDAGEILASDLLEAEARAAGARRNRPEEEMDTALAKLSLFQPNRALTAELKRVLSISPLLRGADLWHLACALYLAGDPSNLPFVTLDEAQGEAAGRLGFKVLPGDAPRESGVHETPAGYGGTARKSKRITRGARTRVS